LNSITPGHFDGSVELGVLGGIYQDMLTQAYSHNGTSADATRTFMDAFGPSAGLAMTNATVPVVYGLSATQQMYDYKLAHGNIAQDYPNVWPFFAPQRQPDGTINYLSINRQLSDGDRKALTPEDRLDLADYRLGQFVYDHYRANYGVNPNRVQQAYLDKLRTNLGIQFPGYAKYGYQQPADVQPKVSKQFAITELTKVANDPRLSDNSAAQGVAAFLHFRDEALTALGVQYQANPGAALLNKANGPSRAWLADRAALVLKTYPEFGPIWQSFFQPEVMDPTAKLQQYG
jgi:hypothetical protein